MGAIGRVFGWFGRKAALFIAIVAALIAHQLILSSWQSHGELKAQVEKLETGKQALADVSTDLLASSDDGLATAQRLSVERLKQRIRIAREAKQAAEAQCGSDLTALLRAARKS